MKKNFPGVSFARVVEKELVDETTISSRSFIDQNGAYAEHDLYSVYMTPYKKPKFGKNLKFFLIKNFGMQAFLLFSWTVLFIGTREYSYPMRAMFNEVYNPKPKANSEIGLLGIETRHKPFFYTNLALTLPYLILTACIAIRMRKKDKRDEQQIINERNTVDLMLAIKSVKEAGKKFNLNLTDESARKLIDVCPYIISKMSADERVYFDMLIDGDIESNENEKPYKNDETLKNLALAIIDGHLKSYPEDMAKVLEVFDETSLAIVLSKMYKQSLAQTRNTVKTK
ncbi:MAG: hypothetical protein J6S80_03375 [Alphaproteobacteria bacterium]|nr:hypothetical protein [Alphaproteobacteria bacterium]